jgi:hypothetical protein
MKELAVLDIEVLPNYFLIAFKKLDGSKVLKIDMFGSLTKLDTKQKAQINQIMKSHTTFGFNSMNFDMPILNYALSGAKCKDIYTMSKTIIEKRMPNWLTYREFEVTERAYDHFDVSEPSPAVMISLKNYGTRIGSKKLQEFYLDPHEAITREDIAPLRDYCENDLDVTIDLYNAIEDRINLRLEMSDTYGLDLRSKSDAQIAEAVICSELEKVGVTPIKPNLSNTYRPRYKAPDYIEFKTPELQELVEEIESTHFDLAANGAVKLPKNLSNRKIVIGNTTYKMGIGGLHSQEKGLSVVSNKTHVMRNADFASYYPFIIILQKLAPKHLGVKFLGIYEKIVRTRLKAKAEGNKLVADSLKITINGSFGKFGSKYSKLYSPDLLLATTITGQLTLLMAIEGLEANGISVVSANTDGLEYFCPRDKVDLAETVILDLELATGYEMEHGEYKALHAANVNNYVAVYEDEVKAKGIYAKTTLSKGRSTPIVFTAIREYLGKGTPIETTVMDCRDINQFVAARTVKGGAVWNDNYLGKMVRWYYSKEGTSIHYKSNGNLVPKTGEWNGVKPMMDLTKDVPADLDYGWYLNEAISKMKDLGVSYES